MGFLSTMGKALASGVFEGVRDGLRGHDTGSGTGVSRACPECGSTLVSDGPADDRGTERFECLNDTCDNPVWFSENGGPLLDPPARATAHRAHRGGGPTCTGCQQPLDGELTPAWSEGNNSSSHITCARCGCRNDLFDDED